MPRWYGCLTQGAPLFPLDRGVCSLSQKQERAALWRQRTPWWVGKETTLWVGQRTPRWVPCSSGFRSQRYGGVWQDPKGYVKCTNPTGISILCIIYFDV